MRKKSKPGRLPNRRDFIVHGSLDEEASCNRFLGLSQVKAKAVFSGGILSYWSDLMWMGPKAFRFYVLPAIEYLVSERSKEAAAELDHFVSAVNFRIKDLADSPERHIVLRGVEMVIKQFEKFGANEVYGFLLPELVKLRGKLRDL